MKTAFIFVFIATVLSVRVCAQNNKRLDSLRRAYTSIKQDTSKVIALLEIALELGKNNPDTIIVLAERSRKSSQKIGYQKGVGRALNALGTARLLDGQYEAALADFAEAEKILSEVRDPQGVASSLHGQGNSHKNQGAFAAALDKYEKSLNICTTIGDKQGIALNLNSIGVMHDYLGDYARSLDYYNKSVSLYQELKNDKGVATALSNIGIIHQNKGEYSEALDYYQKSLTIYERINDRHGIAQVLGNMGIVFYYQSNFPLALELYQKGLQAYEELNHSRGIALILGNIGIIHQDESDYGKALAFHTRSKDLYEKLGDKDGISTSLTNIGNAYAGQKKFALALETYQASLGLTREIKNKSREAINLIEIARLFFETVDYANAGLHYQNALKIMVELEDKQGQADALDGLSRIELKKLNYSECIRYANRGLAIATKMNSPHSMSLLSFTLYQAHKLKGEYKTALQYHELYKGVTDSLYNVEKEKALANLETKADLKLKEKEITVLNKNKEILEAGKTFQQRIIYLVSFGLIVVLVLAYFLYTSRQNERKAKEVIAQQKEEVLRQKEGVQRINDQLQKQTEQLAEANTAKNKLFSIIGHDLRSPMGSLEGMLSLLNQGTLSQEQFHALLPKLQRNVRNVRITLDNLLHWSISQMQGVKASPALLPINELVYEQIDLFAEVSGAKNIAVSANVDQQLQVWADKNHIRLVLRNLLNNALKFTHPHGAVIIEAKHVGQRAIISIKDTGVGMTAEQIDSLFQRRQSNQTKGTQGEPGTGLGLQLCLEVALLNKGEIRVHSEPGKGTTFFFSLPVAQET